MKKLYSFILIGILALTLVTFTSAVLGNFLGVGVPHFFEANSPISVDDKINSESYFGGETIYYKATTINNLEKQVNGFFTIEVSADNGLAMCEDFESVMMSNGIDSGNWTHIPAETLLEPSCIEIEPNVLIFQQEVSYGLLENKTHYAELELKLNVEPANYKVIGSARDLAYS